MENKHVQQNSFWKNLWSLIKPYWSSEEKWEAFLLLGIIIACSVLQVRVMVIINSWRKNFYDALQSFNMHFVLITIVQFLIILFFAIIIFTYGTYFGGVLVNRWRLWMTTKYVKRWLEDHVAYALQVLNKNMDNPDQRISEDLNEFPTLTLNLFAGLFSSVITLVSFSVILWELSGSLMFTLAGRTIDIPGYMFFATIIYAAIGTWITLMIGRRLPRLNYQQEQFNANFRFGLIRVRESCEAIALYRGEQNEKRGLMQLFSDVYNNFFAIIRVQRNLNFFINAYSLATQIVGILIALPRYIAQHQLIGSLIQVLTAFEQVVDALSFIPNSFSTIASWRAVIWRLTEFSRLMDESVAEAQRKHVEVIPGEKPVLSSQQLNLMLPNHEILVHDLEFTIKPSERVIITGKYGSGKSTLLRAIANIWPYGSGNIYIPPAKMLFLPQRPYFPLGSLRRAILYPEANPAISDQEIRQILEDCGLPKLKNRLDEVRYWSAELSLGEQQLIAFARIFLYQPEWVFLDEATSALDEDTEAQMYRLLEARFPKITIVSVGHRSSIKQFHQREIIVRKEKALEPL
jgi:vitamin B12/bleomycin/antimicrobial peptide transport system ATP-binding/permease protein